MMWITQWKHHVTLVFGYLCVTVLSMRGVRSDTYGDLGDEIIIGYPTHQTTRKNQIPTVRDVPQDSLRKRTIVHNSPLDHYKNPLYYREFISEPHPRVPYEKRIPSLRRIAKHFSKINRYRKDFIHRPRYSGQYLPSYIMQPPISPQQAIRMRTLYPRTLRPDPARTLGRGPLRGGTLGRTMQRPAAQPVAPARGLYRVARPKILARPPTSANAKYYLSRRLINERGKVQHHLHVQVVPKGPLDPRKALKLGLHSGFVLLPAKRVPAKRVLPQRPREPVRAVGKPPAANARLRQAIKPPLQPQPHPVQNSRFSERKHIWIPSSHLNAQEIPVQEMTSYHVDEIGNLIPDKDPSKSEQYPAQALKANSQLMKNLGKVTMKWAGYSPILRKNIQKNPTWLEALEGALTPKYPEAKSQASHNRELSSSIYQIVKQVKQSPGAKVSAKKPSLATRTKPKSSRRILYFAQHANPLPKQTLNPRYRPLVQRPRTATPVARYSRPKPNIQRQTTKVSHFIEQLQRSLATPRSSKEYEIPKVSNKVYRYINEKTVPAPGNARAMNTNPLLSYLQYHRTHPSTNERIPSRLPVRQIIHAAPRRLNANMQVGKANAREMLAHHRRRRNIGEVLNLLKHGHPVRQRATPKPLAPVHSYLNYSGLPLGQPLTAMFMQAPGYQPMYAEMDGARRKVPWNYFHNEITQDGRIRPALYPISKHIPPGRCLPDGSLCDKGHDEQCCGKSAFCQDYWGISKCVTYAKLSPADLNDPYQMQRNRIYKNFYRYLQSRV